MTERNESKKNSRVWAIDAALWNSGAAVHLPLSGGAECWACRAPTAPTVVLCPDRKRATTFCSDWETLFPEESLYRLLEIPLTPQGVGNRALALQRGETIAQWADAGGVLVSTGGALLAPLASGTKDLRIEVAGEYNRNGLLDWLVHAGYVRSDVVWSPGQFVFRGYILDLFDPAYAYPLRIEFFDDVVESIRSFAPRTQQSVGVLPSMDIHSLNQSKDRHLHELLPAETMLLYVEPSRIELAAETYAGMWNDIALSMGEQPLPPWQETALRLAVHPRLRLTSAVQQTVAALSLEEIPLFRGNLDAFRWTCSTWREDGYHIRLVTTNPRLLSYDARSDLSIVEGTLSRGFLDSSERVVYVSDLELAGISERIPSPAGFAQPPKEWHDRFTEGQLLIHEEYGLCAFRGSEEVRVSGEVMDSLILEFANNQRLFLPILHLYKITPLPDHVGEEVRLDSLKGVRWRKRIAKTRERVREELQGLVALYARRELVRGVAFPPKDDLFEEFEEAFPFPETRDQLAAIADVSRDMESAYPMDRLLVGDVGYGKTEVAIRAAFKAVQGGKQVAVLVPTTILAQQHYHSFLARLTGFPVRTSLLSRCSTRKEQSAVLKDVEEGRTDILIGTARMLQKDVRFKDLGLIVVDEEHRFGVLSKEKLKVTRENVDVLMLSATPIPRTLALSLKGMRSISVLNDPPRDRGTVLTTAGPWNAAIVRGAIAREVERGGQIFYVTNRIARVQSCVEYLTALFPDLSIASAHGRMKEKELEDTMLDFYQGKIQILVCTTIVESGLDVPGANTLIVENCQELGLAQMYQLRGRVGRREESAFALFLYPEGQPLGRETLERLDSITTLTTGAGYDLALQDLRIRGSGSLIGTSQHGAEGNSVDSYLYYAMLEEEIGKLRGEMSTAAEVTVDIPCLVPSSYIPQESIRITLYRRLLRVEGLHDLASLAREVQDRFGPIPEALRALMDVSFLRAAGGRYGVTSVDLSRKEIVLRGRAELLDELKKKRFWYRMSDKIVGPGGYAGLSQLIHVLRNMREDEVQ